MQLFTLFKKLACYCYGTSYESAQLHHPQARNIAYTIGGLIIFITAPLIFFGTAYLIQEHFYFILEEKTRWFFILASTTAITIAVIWVERALIVLADAIWPHWIAQVAMFCLRLSMVFLFSTVIANKWVLTSYAGPTKTELLLMSREAFEKEQEQAAQDFDLSSLTSKFDGTKRLVSDLENQLANLPAAIIQMGNQVDLCRISENALWVERRKQLKAELDATNINAQAHSKNYECNLKKKAYEKQVSNYRTPLERQLTAAIKLEKRLKEEFTASQEAAKKQTSERSTEFSEALQLSGSDEEAFARVRSKNPEIDKQIISKTLLLAALELLPLLLKMLTFNSPISAETKALLQQESAVFRTVLKESRRNEKSQAYSQHNFSPYSSSQASFGKPSFGPNNMPSQ